MTNISIKQYFLYAVDKLKKINITNPHLEARLLLKHATDKSSEYILMHGEEILSKEIITILEEILTKRLNFKPIAYITGIKEFYGYEFIVNEHVLIPRPETELLLERVLSSATCLLNKLSTNDFKILELGTGSGCIAITLLLTLQNIKVVATDISEKALKVSLNNAIKHNVTDRLALIHSNWLQKLDKQKFDIIVSNPPYIAVNETSNIATETLHYEPHLALFAENNGLKCYEIIARNAKNFLKQNGKLFLEIGYKQQKDVTEIFQNYGYAIDHVHYDLQNYPRVLEISSKTLLRSYARRIGKTLSQEQHNLLINELPQYLFSQQKLKSEKRKIHLEIGFGMGEHFIHQAKINPSILFIGAEVYLNGVASALKLSKQQNISNFLLWDNNLDLILEELPDQALHKIYILFPDPWPKNKQKKKRILNNKRLSILQNKLKDNGILIFSSDIEDYFNQAINLIKERRNLKILNNDNYLTPHQGYITTKYHKKAIQEGSTAKFLQVMKLDN